MGAEAYRVRDGDGRRLDVAAQQARAARQAAGREAEAVVTISIAIDPAHPASEHSVIVVALRCDERRLAGAGWWRAGPAVAVPGMLRKGDPYMTDEHWHDVTAVGDCWEVERTVEGRFRYRRNVFRREAPRESWTWGHPPTGPHATNVGAASAVLRKDD